MILGLKLPEIHQWVGVIVKLLDLLLCSWIRFCSKIHGVNLWFVGFGSLSWVSSSLLDVQVFVGGPTTNVGPTRFQCGCDKTDLWCSNENLGSESEEQQ